MDSWAGGMVAGVVVGAPWGWTSYGAALDVPLDSVCLLSVMSWSTS